jgi:hypothetical protein
MRPPDGISDATFATLGLTPGGTLHVQRLALLDWGQVLELACVQRQHEQPDHPFTLRFTDCREMKWRTYAFDGTQDEVLLVDARLGRGEHRSPAHLLTDRFGVSLFYGALEVAV